MSQKFDINEVAANHFLQFLFQNEKICDLTCNMTWHADCKIPFTQYLQSINCFLIIQITIKHIDIIVQLKNNSSYSLRIRFDLWAVLLILVQWSHDTSIFIKLGYQMYWKEKPISSEFSKRIQSSGKLPSVLYAIFNIIPVLTMSRDTTINDIFKC